jgi:hypothetical protein
MLSICIGTYVASWTWFEAAIIRDDDPNIEEYLLGLHTMQVAQQKALPKVLSVEVGKAPDGSTRWPIQYNIQVSSAFKRHEVTWTDEDRFNKVTEANAAKHGSGTGRGFLSTLAQGDRVAVVARARVKCPHRTQSLPQKLTEPLASWLGEPCVERHRGCILFGLSSRWL